MSDQASFTLRGRNPDVLTCIANLSNDEVFTPPEFANRMLDTLAEAWAAANGGADIWADKTVKFLDIGDKFMEKDGTISKDVMYDALHLTEKGYQIWADAISPKLAELMK